MLFAAVPPKETLTTQLFTEKKEGFTFHLGVFFVSYVTINSVFGHYIKLFIGNLYRFVSRLLTFTSHHITQLTLCSKQLL